MASNLTLFNWQNKIQGPVNVALDRVVVGWVHTDGVKFAPKFNK